MNVTLGLLYKTNEAYKSYVAGLRNKNYDRMVVKLGKYECLNEGNIST